LGPTQYRQAKQRLNKAALKLAKEIQQIDSNSARWIAAVIAKLRLTAGAARAKFLMLLRIYLAPSFHIEHW